MQEMQHFSKIIKQYSHAKQNYDSFIYSELKEDEKNNAVFLGLETEDVGLKMWSYKE